jgi:hypothetical protein
VNEEKGKELGANLDEIRAHIQAVDLTRTWRPISVRAKVRSFFGHRAEPVRQQLLRESQMLTHARIVFYARPPCSGARILEGNGMASRIVS